MTKQKTFWHLQSARRVPSEYEVVTSKLHYYTGRRGFEVSLPLDDWYERYQRASRLACSDWERFTDPRETTYAKYVALAQSKEAFVDGIFRFIDDADYDARLSPGWLATLERVLAPLRHPYHGLQMVAAHLGQMAPSGRITIAATLQAADEMRRVHRLAYRLRQIQRTVPGFGRDAKELWRNDPPWQPLRELVERLLVCFDWGEAFVALNLVAKPALDALLLGRFADAAARAGDTLLGKLFFSFAEDGEWHRDWSRALVSLALSDAPVNRRVVEAWIDAWGPLVERAVASLAPLLDEHADETVEAVRGERESYLASCGLGAGETASRSAPGARDVEAANGGRLRT